MSDIRQIVPFGKYMGQPIEVLQADQRYCEWLMSQDWFREKYPKMITVIVNNFGRPEDTPEHNSLQAMFLDNCFTDKLIQLHFNKVNKNHKKEFHVDKVTFEVNGWDVCVRYSFKQQYELLDYGKVKGKYWDDEYGELFIEIKPCVGDDYPSILRQMNANSRRVFIDGVLIYKNFTASGATEKQVKHIFENSNYKMYSFDEIENMEVENEK